MFEAKEGKQIKMNVEGRGANRSYKKRNNMERRVCADKLYIGVKANVKET